MANNSYSLPGETVTRTYRSYATPGEAVGKSFIAAPYPFKGGTPTPVRENTGQIIPRGNP